MTPRPIKNIIEPIEASFEQVVSKVLNAPIINDPLINFPKIYPHSPLRYPGGKNRAVKEIYSCIPENEKILCSPFLGGASIELACSTRMKVYGYDTFGPLVDFWNVLIHTPNELADAVMKYYPLSKTKFYNLQKIYLHIEKKLDRAAAFFVLNRSSFSGTTLSGGMSPNHPRFTKSAIQRLRDFHVSNFSVKKADFKDSIEKHKDAFLYLDPPYLNGQNLYGVKGDTHKGFEHEALSDILHKRDRWILSYNDCETIQKLYKGYQILNIDWTYGMNKSKISNEVLVVSHDLAA
ncbi:MAG: DNA adenine methylase [Candidatus Omnitrophota bacterium]